MMCRMNTRTSHSDFKGFDDWVEIFRAGTHTDSQGREATYTVEDLDQIITNHSEADSAPIVIGHPKTDDPAYGWTAKLKRNGDSLLAKFRDVEPQFAEAVEAGRYRKRSVRLVKAAQGWVLGHVGFLGAARPAISGLAAMNYAAPQGESHDFEMDAFTPGVIARAMRRLRDFIIEKFDLETADRVMPDWEVESLSRHAIELSVKPANLAVLPAAAFSDLTPDHIDGGDVMPEFSQADIQAAEQRGREAAQADFTAREQSLQDQLKAERRARLAREFQAEIAASHLTPAQAEGAVEFMFCLQDGEEARFEFSAGKETKKLSPLAWFRDFVKRAPKQVDMGEQGAGADASPAAAEFSAPSGYTIDGAQLEMHQKAVAWQQANPGTDYVAAVRAVTK